MHQNSSRYVERWIFASHGLDELIHGYLVYFIGKVLTLCGKHTKTSQGTACHDEESGHTWEFLLDSKASGTM